jgi:hypothetical protein
MNVGFRGQSGSNADIAKPSLLTDTVEKVFSGRRTKFFNAAGASRARQREGHHIDARKSDHSPFVPVLQRLQRRRQSKTDLRDPITAR